MTLTELCDGLELMCLLSPSICDESMLYTMKNDADGGEYLWYILDEAESVCPQATYGEESDAIRGEVFIP